VSEQLCSTPFAANEHVSSHDSPLADHVHPSGGSHFFDAELKVPAWQSEASRGQSKFFVSELPPVLQQHRRLIDDTFAWHATSLAVFTLQLPFVLMPG